MDYGRLFSYKSPKNGRIHEKISLPMLSKNMLASREQLF